VLNQVFNVVCGVFNML